MKKIAFTIAGTRYEVKLEDDFADAVTKDLKEAGVSMERDNTPAALVKAYLRLAKLNNSYEDEIELLIETLDSL
ncbi:hypothetical protein MNB_SV-6-1077 [hydrothermal vent metagenome]|uniref:Cell division protein ZapA n=1 Tax=hydrothermal vent metagenome TaxID=652676 RepID=A0A1W1B8T4_9ZZZZ